MQAVVHGRRKREGLRSKGSKGQARWVWCGGDALSAVLAPGAATRLPAACRQLGQLPAGLPGHQAPSFITLACDQGASVPATLLTFRLQP